MKKLMINTRVLAIALLTGLTMTFASTAIANDEKKIIPVELRYIGNLENQPLFAMVFTSAEEAEFTITIRDEYGNLLYRDNVKGGNITKKFLLNTEELGDTGLRFEVSANKTHKPAVFEITKYSRMVEDVVVSRTK